MTLTELDERILHETKKSLLNQHLQQYEAIIEENFNDYVFTNDYPDYEYFLRDPKDLFNIIKFTLITCKEEYGYDYEFDTLKKIIDLYAYLKARQFMEDIAFNNDEDDRELMEI